MFCGSCVLLKWVEGFVALVQASASRDCGVGNCFG